MITCNDISYSYDGIQNDLEELTYSINQGEWLGIIGPNGSGKSTLLNLLCGLFQPSKGKVRLDGELVSSMSNKQIAKKIAVLSQQNSFTFSYEVKETVKLGRVAHSSSFFPTWTSVDENAVKNAMSMTGINKMANNLINEISGGERQRVFLAQCFAQETPYIFLDEPSNHLDLMHTIRILDMLKELQRNERKTIVTVFHDLNLASLYCDRLLGIKDGKLFIEGKTDSVLTEEVLQDLFDTSFQILDNPETNKKVIIYKSNVL
ncbi:ABC transporter ATP-binding protein [Gottfriedia luciferensis]|uniref:ABC transporter ATP-binding protein n=1 Tax=Gottfriedia luciferensis TaxID=178774 RepID=UPI000B4405DF|nr:ABC transporter ATP-binding protein [Gottfriedia luciferensis]